MQKAQAVSTRVFTENDKRFQVVLLKLHPQYSLRSTCMIYMYGLHAYQQCRPVLEELL